MRLSEKQIKELESIPCSYIEMLEIIRLGIKNAHDEICRVMDFVDSDMDQIRESIEEIMLKG